MVRKKSLRLTFILLITALNTFSQQVGRQNISLNEQWQFKKEDGTTQDVSLPHTWNAQDVLDDAPGYYRGLGVYKRKLKLDESAKNKEIFLVFNGVAQEAEVLVNGTSAGKHLGSYTRFIVKINPYLNFKNDEIEVRVNNRFHEDIPPLTADFTFFGGIYRKVTLLMLNPVHFSQQESGSSGIMITTPKVSARKASINISSVLENTSSVPRKVRLVSTVYNAKGLAVASINSVSTLKKGVRKPVVQEILSIKNPELWSPENPYLYRVISSIIDEKSKVVLDQVLHPLGFR